MEYFITLVEGLLSFLSPCMLPMLPIYLTYLAGNNQKSLAHTGNGEDEEPKDALPGRTYQRLRALCFVLGFTLVFMGLGLFAGTLGVFLQQHKTLIQFLGGLFILILGLLYFLDAKIFSRFSLHSNASLNPGYVSAILFGMVYSINLTPCVGPLLGSALVLASTAGTVGKGGLLLLCYSLGLGIPFLLSAELISVLEHHFTSIRKHFDLIRKLSGILLILMGLFMMLNSGKSFLEETHASSTQESTSAREESSNKEESNSTKETQSSTTETGSKDRSDKKDLPLAADFSFQDAVGNYLDVSSFYGSPMVINFWASWCPPCVGELPAYEAMYQTYGDSIEFLMINLTDGSRDTVEHVEAFVQENGYTFPVYFDQKAAGLTTYGYNSIPVSIFIDAEGYIHSLHLGGMSQEELEENLTEILP
ncbi:MAG: redoxin domain-containing protein [Lachnospiraceae bacterium]|nr:redoxin domain-containing protein [Lachnospiraceae bacterium]